MTSHFKNKPTVKSGLFCALYFFAYICINDNAMNEEEVFVIGLVFIITALLAYIIKIVIQENQDHE